MVERKLYICFITVYLGFVFGLNQTTENETEEYYYEDTSDVGNFDPALHDKPKSNLSCITCNNVNIDECNDPKNKQVPSRLCQNYDDVCYSMHTPFGVIDRGCYNPNHNMTTYVCSCNLCNSLPINLLPVKFTNVKHWLANVIDLSRTRGLRKSILKKISCVQCESNRTFFTSQPSDKSEYKSEYKSDVNNSTSCNCYDGNINALPVEECSHDEICGIRYIKIRGYIWRGCISKPLYNYWWSFCRKDRCNYEKLASFYN